LGVSLDWIVERMSSLFLIFGRIETDSISFGSTCTDMLLI